MSRCLFEYMCSHNADKPITILLPRQEEEAFVKGLGDNFRVIYEALGRIDSRKAEAKEDADLKAINASVQLIEQDLKAINSTVKPVEDNLKAINAKMKPIEENI